MITAVYFMHRCHPSTETVGKMPR